MVRQDTKNPDKLTKDQARELCHYLNSYNQYAGTGARFEVRQLIEIGAQIQGSVKDIQISGTVTMCAAVNDHICPSCKNDRCSKTERTCWLCGGKL